MKKRIIALFALIAVFGLAIAAVAYAQKTRSESAKSSCCSKDACPMKKAGHDESGDHAKAEHVNCCSGSCPMKKNGETKATTVSTSESDKYCCENCDCCKGKYEPTV